MAVMFGRKVDEGTVVMGDIEPNSLLVALPPIKSHHLVSMQQVRNQEGNESSF